MKVCLIIPPSIFLLDERVFPNLGILKVAGSLEHSNIKVDVLDLSGIENFEDAINDYVTKVGADWYGITATTPQYPASRKILEKIKKSNPQSKVMIGGPHPTLICAAYKREQKNNCINGRAYRALVQMQDLFDCIVAGDGELAIHEAIKGNQKIIDADDPTGPLFMSNKIYDATSFPSRHLIDLNSYHYFIENHRSTSLIAQLGCPFQCTFCSGRDSPMLRHIRTRTVNNIIEEMRQIYYIYRYTGFMFYDDELNVSKTLIELMNAVHKLQQELGVEFRLRGFIKSELFTEAQAKAMYNAGFRWILVGFEAGSPRILENIQKKATVDDNTRCIQIAHNNGLKVKALMSIGHAGECESTICDTYNWIEKVKPDDFDATIITTYPGSPYYDRAIETQPGIWTFTATKSGDKLHSYELDYSKVSDYYKGDPSGGYKAYVFTDYLSSENLVKLRNEFEKNLRLQLKIPFNQSATPIRYEHSMGQGGILPTNILRGN